ncbi:MAG: hypothetical protein K9W44_09610 [Candidatus Lokiarchaeota archaeon]|nr:hypothetical protein [Candidatus Harpocratesius repetitus]
MCSMYRKYLLKRDFWAVPKKNGEEPNCYVKHDVNIGGIYAYLKHRGVKITVQGETRYFNNFTDLDQFLDQLKLSTRAENSEFMAIINRRTTTKYLRQIPL